jgi:hypothetical protein
MAATSPADPPGIERRTGPWLTPPGAKGSGPPGDFLWDAKANALDLGQIPQAAAQLTLHQG